MSLSLGIRWALRFIRNTGIKKGANRAKELGIPKEEIDIARGMAFAEPKKYLPKWHSLNKSKVQKKIDERNKWLDKARREGF